MDIKNVADLAKIADLCRKKGIETIKISENSIEFTLSSGALEKKPRRSNQDPSLIETERQYSEEDVLLWSAGGVQ